MSKSICGSRYTLNIDKLNLTDFSLSTVDVKSEIKGDYLTANRGIATDSNKKLVSTTATDTEINYLSGVSSAIQTQLDAKQATITAGSNLSFDGNTLNATGGGSSTITANRVAVSDGTGALTASSITTTELDFLDGVSSAIQTQLNAKQATIADGDLTIAKTSGLQTALDTKQATIADDDLTIARTSGLQTALDTKLEQSNFGTGFVKEIGSNNILLLTSSTVVESASNSGTAPTVSAVATGLALKQNTIADGDLTIAKTSGLQTALDSKQPTIADGDLTIARTSGLQTALDTKQATIGDGDLTIARTSGLQTALDTKQATIGDGDLSIARTSGLQTALDTKQATIGDGDLSIARTSGLQTALDTKQNILRIYNTQSLSSPNDNMYKIKNMLVLPLHTELTITSNQTVLYFPNLYASANKSTTYDSAVVGRAIIDNDVFSIVEPTYNTETTNSSDKITGTNARFGVKILATGLYKITYNYNVENETHPNRLAIQIVPAILNTLTNGTEQNTLPLHLTSREYLRDNDFGQWANVGGSGLIEVSSDMLSSSNGVFVKIDIRMIRSGGEVFNENCNSIIVNYGGLEIQKIADLAT